MTGFKVALGCAVAVAAALSAAAAPSVVAGPSTACMTRQEFRAVKDGMPHWLVADTVGSWGRLVDYAEWNGKPESTYRWRVCTRAGRINEFGYATVTFRGRYVERKFFRWV